jgi:hypothetical protein
MLHTKRATATPRCAAANSNPQHARKLSHEFPGTEIERFFNCHSFRSFLVSSRRSGGKEYLLTQMRLHPEGSLAKTGPLSRSDRRQPDRRLHRHEGAVLDAVGDCRRVGEENRVELSAFGSLRDAHIVADVKARMRSLSGSRHAEA